MAVLQRLLFLISQFQGEQLALQVLRVQQGKVLRLAEQQANYCKKQVELTTTLFG
jgi:hypothetical protein